MSNPQKYWFPAKRYGWGWGVPSTWQGWAVVVAFVALLAGGSFFLPRLGAVVFAGYAIVLTLLLVAVCWLKGEPPHWRWGPK